MEMTRLSYRNAVLNHEVTAEGEDAKAVSRLWNMGMRLVIPNWNYRHNLRDGKGRWRMKADK
jgi:hypothetical protein